MRSPHIAEHRWQVTDVATAFATPREACNPSRVMGVIRQKTVVASLPCVVHVRRGAATDDLCREAPKQIVLTTHSPVLLDYVSAECIRLMTIRSGRSSLRRLLDFTPAARELITEGDMPAFEICDSGLVREAIPPGFILGDLDE